ncbi:MAG: hypothetical protein RLZZ511_4325 [Cyanobacteriota bacterium]|jgi:hypothetical protein
MTIPDIRAKIAALQRQRSQISQLDYLTNCRLELAYPGGTAGKASQEKPYGRLRSGKGNLLPNGKRSQYVPVDDVVNVEAQIERGRQIKTIDREIGKLERLAESQQVAAIKLGLLSAV